MLPIWQEQEDRIKKLQADLEEVKKLNKELQDQAKSS
jgi:type II secretory pathway component PulM